MNIEISIYIYIYIYIKVLLFVYIEILNATRHTNYDHISGCHLVLAHQLRAVVEGQRVHHEHQKEHRADTCRHRMIP